ncbi:hypothetical protein [Actinospongicola halichondriae]|uniref:hypothetical protein n=1 Tax=Actinospongicola halichondriae TaxID=3236844 RepID=UPI003D4AD2A3
MCSLRSVVATVVLCALVAVAGAPPAAAGGGAPATTRSADGRSVSGAGKTLTVSQADGLASSGQTLRVDGSGYDEARGVYVSLCVIPPEGTTPSPCGGGVDRENTSGASAWISSDPPSYATGVSQPYEPGGAFSVTIEVSPAINADLDCRQVRCAIVTRNDHTRGSDRSQDLLIPVTFADPSVPTTMASPPEPTPSTAPTTTTLPPTAFAPDAALSADGHRVDDGTRAMTVDEVEGLDPAGATVIVDGAGFAPDVGVYVALCRVPEANAVPGPCTTGGAASAWLSSTPPDYGEGLAKPFADDGSFRVELELSAAIDDTTDCRVDPCAITVRRDDTATDDRTSDLFVPVVFASESPSTTEAEQTEPTEPAAGPVDLAGADDASVDDGGASGVLVALAIGLVVIGVGGAWFVRKRSVT